MTSSMTDPLDFDGERFTPECVREIWYEHFHRYVFASRWVKGLRVLDAACGEGYGSALMASSGARVTGVDVAEDAVAHARRRYGDRDELRFECADVTRLPFPDDHFDAVVSFETLEHLKPQQDMLAAFRRVLKPDGWLLISTPDKSVYNRQLAEPNPHHVAELERDEFEGLLRQHFPAYRLYGQKLVFHSAIWSSDGDGFELGLYDRDCDRIERGAMPESAMYWLALAAAEDTMLPTSPPQLDLFADREESVYQHYYHEIRKNIQAGGILAERDREIADLRGRLKAAEAEADSRGRPRWWHKLLR